MRGRQHGVGDNTGRDAARAVLFDHGSPDGRGGQGAEPLARLLTVQLLHVEPDAGRRPAEPVVRRGRLVFQRQPAGHRWRFVAHRWRHVRQHNTVDGHSPPAGRSVACAAAAARVVMARNRLLQNNRQIILFSYYDETLKV